MERAPSEQALQDAAELLNLLREQGFDLEDVRNREVHRVSLWQGGIKNAEHEWETHDLYGIELRSEYDEDKEPFSPATPAKITPSRRKGVERDHEVFVALGDAQIDYRRLENGELSPLHDERAMRAARYLLRDLQPDTIVNLGDHVDLSGLSKFKPDSDHFHRTLGPSFQRAHDFYAELRADHPDARIVEVDSNHNTRLKDYVLRYMPDLYGFRRASDSDEYPVMTYPYLANLAHLDVEWISGYGAAELELYEDITFRHGTEHSSKTTTAAAKALNNRPEVTTIQGHDHRRSEAWRTNRNGEYIGALIVGTLARTDGIVPGFHSAVDDLGEVVHNQQNWQSTLLIGRRYPNGHTQYEQAMIRDGVLQYREQEYDGRE